MAWFTNLSNFRYDLAAVKVSMLKYAPGIIREIRVHSKQLRNASITLQNACETTSNSYEMLSKKSNRRQKAFIFVHVMNSQNEFSICGLLLQLTVICPASGHAAL